MAHMMKSLYIFYTHFYNDRVICSANGTFIVQSNSPWNVIFLHLCVTKRHIHPIANSTESVHSTSYINLSRFSSLSTSNQWAVEGITNLSEWLLLRLLPDALWVRMAVYEIRSRCIPGRAQVLLQTGPVDSVLYSTIGNTLVLLTVYCTLP